MGGGKDDGDEDDGEDDVEAKRGHNSVHVVGVRLVP